MKKVSIIDVARQAGVSVSTVSLVLREKGKISAATIEKVHAAIEALGYVHNVAAANLRGKTSNLIGLVVEDLNDPFSTRVTASLVQALEAQGFMVFLTQPGRDTSRLESCFVSFTRQGVAGVVYLTADSRHRALPAPVVQSTLPLVVVSQSPVEEKRNSVVRDNRQAGGLAGRYLIERGHRDIGVIPGQLERNTGVGRFSGFMKALEEAAIKVPENWIVQGDFEPESGYRAMQQILSQPQRPTAVFCGGDIMAMGAICAADEMGLRVPQDISIIGYDNVRNARFFSPALTTIHQPKETLGQTAFNMLLDRIVNKREESQTIEVHPRLIERRSVADGPFRDYRR
ncbi:substrate-binding domain-containing protein [Cronobacter sakazakii]|uniref:substrate-binding domain-containing protein n=3 Tax=Cronobacter sakazakii TaxID=28141 RepID=UPI000F5ED937|nr:substrate-binding domain-containing protein [Cronobacter sakazakii]RRA45255.1 LacI family transcriptional regulator [Cronobacter sakazakii]